MLLAVAATACVGDDLEPYTVRYSPIGVQAPETLVGVCGADVDVEADGEVDGRWTFTVDPLGRINGGTYDRFLDGAVDVTFAQFLDDSDRVVGGSLRYSDAAFNEPVVIDSWRDLAPIGGGTEPFVDRDFQATYQGDELASYQCDYHPTERQLADSNGGGDLTRYSGEVGVSLMFGFDSAGRWADATFTRTSRGGDGVLITDESDLTTAYGDDGRLASVTYTDDDWGQPDVDRTFHYLYDDDKSTMTVAWHQRTTPESDVADILTFDRAGEMVYSELQIDGMSFPTDRGPIVTERDAEGRLSSKTIYNETLDSLGAPVELGSLRVSYDDAGRVRQLDRRSLVNTSDRRKIFVEDLDREPFSHLGDVRAERTTFIPCE